MEMLRRYCERGEPISSARVARMIASSDALTTGDRLRLFLNNVAMARKRDTFRRRYLKELAVGLR